MRLALTEGILLGLPQFYSNYQTFNNPEIRSILERAGYPSTVTQDDPKRFQYVKNYCVWMKLAIGTAGAYYLRSSRLGLLWVGTLAGYVLLNSAIVTGWDFENFHWYYVHAPLAYFTSGLRVVYEKL